MNRRKFLKFSFQFFFVLLFNFFSTTKAFGDFLKKKNTFVFTHPIFLKKIFSEDHPEKPERLTRILQELKNRKMDNLIKKINLNLEVDFWINQIHSTKHMESLKKKFPLAEHLSSTAVRGCIEAVDQIMSKQILNAFCLSRPPGHHALNTGKDEGFCFYNHVAIAAKYIQQKHNKKRILIIDWDYHHGNATELFFYSDPDVFCFSTHNLEAYPGTGFPERTGSGKGKGLNVNIHLPCNTNDQDILRIYKDVLVKKADSFKPEFILISAGFDSREEDLLGCFNITDSGFEKLTKVVMSIANIHCQGRVLSVLEGGYNVEGNSSATASHIKILNNFNK